MIGRIARPADERVRLFTFTVNEPKQSAAASARRKRLAEHMEGLLGARIVAEHVERPGRVRVTVATSRPVAVTAARDHAKAWPGTVQGTFTASGTLSPPIRPGPRRIGPHKSGFVPG